MENEKLTVFWKNHIAQWKSGGLGQAEYCRQNKLIPHRFTYWKTKFKTRDESPGSFKMVKLPRFDNAVIEEDDVLSIHLLKNGKLKFHLKFGIDLTKVLFK